MRASGRILALMLVSPFALVLAYFSTFSGNVTASLIILMAGVISSCFEIALFMIKDKEFKELHRDLQAARKEIGDLRTALKQHQVRPAGQDSLLAKLDDVIERIRAV